jgi:hypothetical protein
LKLAPEPGAIDQEPAPPEACAGETPNSDALVHFFPSHGGRIHTNGGDFMAAPNQGAS